MQIWTDIHIDRDGQIDRKTDRQYNEKVLGETQTLHAGCSKAEPKIFVPPQTHSRGCGMAKILISWRWSLPSPTNPVL